jgi:hypothetical protein
MLKRIPKSDISIRPFKAYKEWTFDDTSFPASSSLEINERVTLYDADFNIPDTEYATMSYSSSDYPTGNIYKYYPKSVYGQLRAQFYNGNEDNPFTRTGHKNNEYDNIDASKDRFLSGSAKVISIPQIYVGEGIKKGSVLLVDGNTEYVDDLYGNIIDTSGDSITIISVDNEDNELIFTDLLATPYTASFQFMGFDIQSGTFNLIYNGTNYDSNIISFDVELGIMVVDNIEFLQGEAAVSKIGNVFYNQGLIVITRDVANKLTSGWQLDYKSTQTIYENEYLLIVNQDEFNVSTNPSAVVNVGKETEFVTGSDGKIQQVVKTPGVNYIRKKTELSNGDILDYTYSGSISSSITNTWVSGGFEQSYTMTSIDSTGSFLTPMITTIGLYDDELNLVAVAKLPQPIKSEHDMPVNFIVRFDT